MTAENFIDKLADIMDTDVEDWDSLSMVSFYSFCNAALNKKVLPEEIKSAQTVEDLFKLANA